MTEILETGRICDYFSVTPVLPPQARLLVLDEGFPLSLSSLPAL